MEQILKVLSIDNSSETVKVFYLWSESELVDFEPGSFIDIKTPYGWRSYSLLDERCINNIYRIAVKRDDKGRKGSLWMHQEVFPKDILLSRSPKNNFNVKENKNKNVFIAGGIGLTPLLSLMKGELNKKNHQIFYFSYGSKSDKIVFDKLIAENKINNLKINMYSTEIERKHINFNDLIDVHGLNVNYFCCGPTGMIDLFKKIMVDRGIKNYFFEHFHAERKEIINSSLIDHLEHSIYLAKSQKVVMMSSNDYILEALKREGINVAYSCESGICGTCEARILKGQVEHNDYILSEAEKEQGEAVILCTARPSSVELILDL